jgi:hypothetical protein
MVNATPQPLYPQERDTGTHRILCWVGHRAGLDGCRKSRPHWDSIPGPSTIASRYTDYSIPVPFLGYEAYHLHATISQCNNFWLRKVIYETDVSVVGLRQKWPNSRLSCSFGIQMERLSHTIKSSGKPKTSWDLGMYLSSVQPYYVLTLSHSHHLLLPVTTLLHVGSWMSELC